ncbi:hypothetical protein ACTXT7_011374 [Hymenolepis weldensis]
MSNNNSDSNECTRSPSAAGYVTPIRVMVCFMTFQLLPANYRPGGFELDGCLDDGCLMPADIFSDDADEESADSDEEADMDCGREVGGVSSTSANAANAERGGQKKVLKSMSVGVRFCLICYAFISIEQQNNAGVESKYLLAYTQMSNWDTFKKTPKTTPPKHLIFSIFNPSSQIKQKVVSLLKRLKLADPNELPFGYNVQAKCHGTNIKKSQSVSH